MLARADADPALPFRVGEIGIGDACPPSPAPSRRRRRGRAWSRRTTGRPDRGIRRGFSFSIVASSSACVMPFALAFGQPGDVDGHDDVGRRVLRLRPRRVPQALVEEQHLGLDAGLGREGVEHRLDQFRLPIGVDVDGAVGERRGRKQGGECRPRSRRSPLRVFGRSLCLSWPSGFKAPGAVCAWFRSRTRPLSWNLTIAVKISANKFNSLE